MDSGWDEDPCLNGYQPKEKMNCVVSGLDFEEDQLQRLSPATGNFPGGSNPKQYALPAGAQELQDLIEYREMNFAVGNIFKAAYRLGHCDHGDELRDLRKIMWFADREIQRISKKEVQG